MIGHRPAQVEILPRRARILRRSITLAAVTVPWVGVLILGLLIAAFWPLQIGGARSDLLGGDPRSDRLDGGVYRRHEFGAARRVVGRDVDRAARGAVTGS